MSPAPKYRARTCNIEVEIKGVGVGERRAPVESSICAVMKRVEGTGVADEADVETDDFVIGLQLRSFAALRMTILR